MAGAPPFPLPPGQTAPIPVRHIHAHDRSRKSDTSRLMPLRLRCHRSGVEVPTAAGAGVSGRQPPIRWKRPQPIATKQPIRWACRLRRIRSRLVPNGRRHCSAGRRALRCRPFISSNIALCHLLHDVHVGEGTVRWSSHVGRRLQSTIELACVHTGVAHKARAEQPSLASVGGGMTAGAAFAHPQAADARRSRPIFLDFAPPLRSGTACCMSHMLMNV